MANKKWLIYHWDSSMPKDARVEDQVSFDCLGDTRDYMLNQLEEWYTEIGDDFVPPKEYTKGPVGTVADYIIYDLPDESTDLNRILLCQARNGFNRGELGIWNPHVFGLCVWRNGTHPD